MGALLTKPKSVPIKDQNTKNRLHQSPFMPLHHARAASDHEPGGGLLRDRNRESGAGQSE
jgi:hypothetical protein